MSAPLLGSNAVGLRSIKELQDTVLTVTIQQVGLRALAFDNLGSVGAQAELRPKQIGGEEPHLVCRG